MTTMMCQTNSAYHHVLLFDGVCNLCNKAVQIVLRQDRSAKIMFCPLQSAKGESLLRNFNMDPATLNSLVYIRNERVLIKSQAVIAIMKDMGGIWKMGKVLKIFPRVFGDYFYDVVAKSRYKWFGKRGECMIPTADIKTRFL